MLPSRAPTPQETSRLWVATAAEIALIAEIVKYVMMIDVAGLPLGFSPLALLVAIRFVRHIANIVVVGDGWWQSGYYSRFRS